jgi:hypothetical protein
MAREAATWVPELETVKKRLTEAVLRGLMDAPSSEAAVTHTDSALRAELAACRAQGQILDFRKPEPEVLAVSTGGVYTSTWEVLFPSPAGWRTLTVEWQFLPAQVRCMST